MKLCENHQTVFSLKQTQRFFRFKQTQQFFKNSPLFLISLRHLGIHFLNWNQSFFGWTLKTETKAKRHARWVRVPDNLAGWCMCSCEMDGRDRARLYEKRFFRASAAGSKKKRYKCNANSLHENRYEVEYGVYDPRGWRTRRNWFLFRIYVSRVEFFLIIFGSCFRGVTRGLFQK